MLGSFVIPIWIALKISVAFLFAYELLKELGSFVILMWIA